MKEKTKKTLHRSFGAAFRVHADVANCFGSIYTHSLEWAIQGYDKTKSNLNKKGPNHWSCDFDKSLRRAKRNETVGLPIGPSTSSIAVEIILATVDKELTKKTSSLFDTLMITPLIALRTSKRRSSSLRSASLCPNTD